MKTIYIALSIACCAISGYLFSGNAAPVILFTDLASGPNSGNSDDSQPGQVAGTDGAIVTVWGRNLDSVQGSSQILVDGKVARIYSWGNATAPADLYTKLKLQMVVFQIPSTTASGTISIEVKVNNTMSNSLPFTIRPGNIFFIKSTGNDASGDGSWSQPWKTLDNSSYTGAIDKMQSGDIIYLCNGTDHSIEDGDRACIDFGQPGLLLAPKALVGYPGATVTIGNPTVEKAYSLFVSGVGYTYNYTVAKLSFIASATVVSLFDGFRFVGNKVTAPNGDGPTGAVGGQGNNLYLLGNELTQIGNTNTSKLYHPVYFQSAEACSGPRLPTEKNREIGWNYMHDNLAFDGINLYRECGSSAYMDNQRVHDNYILNQTGDGIRIGNYVCGENWFYNNMIINAGIGPDPQGDEAHHIPVEITAGWTDTTTLIHFYNNTIYGGGFTGGASWASGMVGFDQFNQFTLDFRNNIIVSTVSGIDYLNSQYTIPASGYAEHNLWYGAGAAPAWDSSPLNADPQFTNASNFDFSLKSMSPAVDAATPLTATTSKPLPSFDLFSTPRPQGAQHDMGAVEYASTPTGLPSVHSETKSVFSLYPNPSNGNFKLTFNLNASDDASIEIYTSLSELIYTEEFYQKAGVTEKTVTLNALPRGIYFIKFVSDKTSTVKSFIVGD